MKIALDAMGGDHGPAPCIEGALQAAQELNVDVILVGDEKVLSDECYRLGCTDGRLSIKHAPQVVEMHESPAAVARKKRDSSIWIATELVKSGEAEAVVSPGNTGASMVASFFVLGLIKGVERPAIATSLPTLTGEAIMLDVGANVDCSAQHLAQFAIMGSLYCSEVRGTKNPRVGILSNGCEERQGTDLTREAHKLCRGLGLNYIGYVEGHDLFNDKVEVVVTDGFLGNIVLKTCESMGRAVGGFLKRELNATPIRRLGKVLAGNALLALKTKLDPDIYGGAPLLGLNGTVIKAHGSANARAIKNAIRVATETIQHHLNESIVKEISKTNELVTAPANT